MKAPRMQATIIRVQSGQVLMDVTYIDGFSTSPRTLRLMALEAYKSICPDADARCDYQIDGAWEIVTQSLPMQVLGNVIFE